MGSVTADTTWPEVRSATGKFWLPTLIKLHEPVIEDVLCLQWVVVGSWHQRLQLVQGMVELGSYRLGAASAAKALRAAAHLISELLVGKLPATI